MMSARKLPRDASNSPNWLGSCFRFWPILLDLLLSFLVVVAYLPAAWRHSGEFIFDDGEAVLRNPVVQGHDCWWPTGLLTSDFWGRQIRSSASHKSYRPLTTLSFIVECRLAGDCLARVGRLSNVALHAACAVTLRRALVSFKTDPECFNQLEADFIGAALFAVHPVNSEAICSLVGRAEILMALFALIALRRLAEALKCSTESQIRRSALVEFFFLATASLFCKEQGIMLYPVGALFVVWRLGRQKAATPAVFLAVSGAATLLARLWINGFETPKFSAIDNPFIYQLSPLRLVNYGYTWWLSIKLLTAPVTLSADYSSGSIEFFNTLNYITVLLFIIAVASVIAIAWRVETEVQMLVLFGLLFFLPCCHLFVTVGFTIAERVLYLPCAAFCAAVARRRMPPAIWATLVGMALWRTAQRADEWNSSLSLYSAGVQALPNNVKLRYNLAKTLADLGRIDEARRHYVEVLRLYPRHSQALNNLALLISDGDYGDGAAENMLRAAVRAQPSLAGAWTNLGVTLMHKAKFTEAEASLLESRRLRPHHADTLYNLGNLYVRLNRTTDACRFWRDALRINPQHAAALHNLRHLQARTFEAVNVKKLL